MENRVTGIIQICFVVRNLDESIKLWNDTYGVGPWFYYRFGPEGGPKIAVCDNMTCQLELIQPGENDGYADFLRKNGPGLHHIAVNPTNNLDALRDQMSADGGTILNESIDPTGCRNAYVDMREKLGAIFEIYGRPEGYVPPAPSGSYPENAEWKVDLKEDK